MVYKYIVMVYKGTHSKAFIEFYSKKYLNFSFKIFEDKIDKRVLIID